MSGASTIYAHTLPNRPPSDWETLEAHAAGVAGLARSLACGFDAGEEKGQPGSPVTLRLCEGVPA
jgi:hypothetical protein